MTAAPDASRRGAGDWIVTCGGLGLLPVASGTFGTLGGVAAILLLWPLREQPWFHFGGAVACLCGLLLIAGIPLGTWAERRFGRKDPGEFVLDELVGYWVALLRLDGDFPAHPWRTLAAAFLAFRVFDVVKPPPARWVEAHFSGGFGIMLDDVVAGLYAWMFVYVMEDWIF